MNSVSAILLFAPDLWLWFVVMFMPRGSDLGNAGLTINECEVDWANVARKVVCVVGLTTKVPYKFNSFTAGPSLIWERKKNTQM